MAAPQIFQGTLNRLLTSVIVPDFPNLNITSSFLTKESVKLARQGNTVTMLPTLVGTVTSPEPFVMMTAACHILKTNGLAQQFEDQLKLDGRIGEVTVISDTLALGSYTFYNAALETVDELNFAGVDPGYVVRITGYYPINANLFT